MTNLPAWVTDLYEGDYRSRAMTDVINGMPGAQDRLLREIEEIRYQADLRESQHTESVAANVSQERVEALEESNAEYRQYQRDMDELNGNDGCLSFIFGRRL